MPKKNYVIDSISDEELVKVWMQSDKPLSRCRKVFSSWSGKIDQEQQQKSPLSPIELRRMEFRAVEDIVDAFYGK